MNLSADLDSQYTGEVESLRDLGTSIDLLIFVSEWMSADWCACVCVCVYVCECNMLIV